MSKGNLLASAGSKENLQEIINKYYYSTNYIITEDNKIYNTKLDKVLDSVKVTFSRKRWRFEMV